MCLCRPRDRPLEKSNSGFRPGRIYSTPGARLRRVIYMKDQPPPLAVGVSPPTIGARGRAKVSGGWLVAVSDGGGVTFYPDSVHGSRNIHWRTAFAPHQGACPSTSGKQ